MTVEAGNKIIAEFMGFDITPFENFGGKGYTVFPKGSRTGGASKYGELSVAKELVISGLNKYHSSWDWLMPVVEKIEDVETIGQRVYVTISPFSVDVYCSGVLDKKLPVLSYKEDGKKFNDEEKRLAVWRCVIKTIQWYNSQTPQQ